MNVDEPLISRMAMLVFGVLIRNLEGKDMVASTHKVIFLGDLKLWQHIKFN